MQIRLIWTSFQGVRVALSLPNPITNFGLGQPAGNIPVVADRWHVLAVRAVMLQVVAWLLTSHFELGWAMFVGLCRTSSESVAFHALWSFCIRPHKYTCHACRGGVLWMALPSRYVCV